MELADAIAEIRRKQPSGQVESDRIAFLTVTAQNHVGQDGKPACQPAIDHCVQCRTWEELADGYLPEWAYWMLDELGNELTKPERDYWIVLVQRDPAMAGALWKHGRGLDTKEANDLLETARKLPGWKRDHDRGEIQRDDRQER